MKKKEIVRYSSPRITGTGAMLSELICASVRFNVQVNPLTNINAITGEDEEPLYFEF